MLEVEAHALRVLDALQRGRPGDRRGGGQQGGPHASRASTSRAPRSTSAGPEALVHGSRVELLWRQSLWETIGGGTSEVMRGVIAKQGLGLAGRT